MYFEFFGESELDVSRFLGLLLSLGGLGVGGVFVVRL